MEYNQKFDTKDFYKLHLLHLALRVEREQSSFFMWNKDLYKTSGNILMLSSVLEDNNAILDAYKAIDLTYKTMTNDTAAYYQHAAGPYAWQASGQNKLKNLVMKNIGFTAENFVPANAIEKGFGPSSLNQ